MLIQSLLKPEIKQWFIESAESELFASHLYQYLANQMQRLGYFGAQKYFQNESSEELKHYNKLKDFVNDMGDILGMPATDEISNPIMNIGDALYLSYQTELDLMKQYQEFYEKSEELDDCVTATFLIEFLQIQRISVGEYGDFISRYQKNISDVYEFDEYLEEQVNG